MGTRSRGSATVITRPGTQSRTRWVDSRHLRLVGVIAAIESARTRPTPPKRPRHVASRAWRTHSGRPERPWLRLTHLVGVNDGNGPEWPGVYVRRSRTALHGS